MKTLALALAVALGFGIVRSDATRSMDLVFTGEVMCGMCAQLGSHDRLGYRLTSNSSPEECTQACVRLGSKLVLNDATHRMVYELDDQQLAGRFAGMKVQILGGYDDDSNTIQVVRIQAASALAYRSPCTRVGTRAF